MQLGLGTVQFGLDYGASNTRGQCPPAEVKAILALGAAQGIDLLDTAATYGESESVLGRCVPPDTHFRMVTKTARFRGWPIGDAELARVESTFRRSLERLRRDSVYGLLVHSCDDLFAPGGERLMSAVQEFKARGLVEKIGVSVYDGVQVDRVMAEFELDLIQAPVNVLDQRLLAGGHLSALKEAGVEVHARSVFLQGLLLMEPDATPAYLEPVRPLLREYHAAIAAAGMSPVEAALAFAKGVGDVDAVLVGVTTADELDEILAAFAAAADTGVDFSRFALADECIMNPALWETPMIVSCAGVPRRRSSRR